MWIALGIIIAALVLIVIASMKVSGDMSRLEEQREYEKFKEPTNSL